MNNFDKIFETLSRKYYGQKVPQKYWYSGSLYLIFLIYLSLYNATFLTKLGSSLLSIKYIYIKIILLIIFLTILLLNLRRVINSLKTKSLFNSFIRFIPSVFLISISAAYQYIYFVYGEKQLKFETLFQPLESRFDNNILFLITSVTFEGLFYIFIFKQIKNITTIIEIDYELQKSSKHLQLMIETRKKDQRESFSALYSEKQKSIEEQLKIFSAIQHELGNKIPALKHDLNDLRDFFNSKKNNGIDISKEPIRDLLPGEKLTEISTVEELIQRMNKKITYCISSIDSLGSIIKASPNSFKAENQNLFNYLLKEKEKTGFDVLTAKVIVEGDTNINLNIDSKQFSFLVQNFISNAFRHGGFEKFDKEYFILFKFYQKGSEIVLDIINNGNQLSHNYTIKQFLEPYNYHGSSGNSGLGGYLIGIVIKNHSGKIEIVDKISENVEYKVCFRITLPIK
jgi:signal transduction histidine kinase